MQVKWSSSLIGGHNLLFCLYTHLFDVTKHFLKLVSKIFLMQVNPHTHQVKLCDFGSAKVLVCFATCYFLLFGLHICFYFFTGILFLLTG